MNLWYLGSCSAFSQQIQDINYGTSSPLWFNHRFRCWIIPFAAFFLATVQHIGFHQNNNLNYIGHGQLLFLSTSPRSLEHSMLCVTECHERPLLTNRKSVTMANRPMCSRWHRLKLASHSRQIICRLFGHFSPQQNCHVTDLTCFYLAASLVNFNPTTTLKSNGRESENRW